MDISPKLDPATGEAMKDADGNIIYESNVEIGFMTDAKTDGNRAVISTSSVSATVTIDTVALPNEAVFDMNIDGAITSGVRVKKGTSTTMGNVTISYDEDGTIKIVDGNAVPKETASIGSKVTKDANGKSVASFDEKFKTSLEISNYYPTGSDDKAYLSVVGEDNADKITYIADTGELLLSLIHI